jgi:hypothetical protein
MSEKTRLALGILAASMLLGLVGNWLLWASDWGINMGLWLAVAVASVFALQRAGATARLPGGVWPFVAVLFFGFAYAWRDSGWLHTLDVLVIVVALSMPFWRPIAGSIRRALAGEAVVGGAHAALGAMTGWAFVLDPAIKWPEVNQGGAMRHGVGVLMGLALALPLLLVFGGLFMSADAGFEQLIKGAFSLNPDELIGHVFLVGILAWGTGGFLYAMFSSRQSAGAAGPALSLGIVAVATVLVMLVALFGTFVALQLPYLFGGAEAVSRAAGLTLAEYARRGFFELVTVTALALPMLLALHALIGRPTRVVAQPDMVDAVDGQPAPVVVEPDEAAARRGETVFRWLAGAMLVLLGVIIASAVQRMWLYQATFGWTTARLYVLAFEFWLGVVLVWFAATVLRGRRDAFLFGAVAWGMVASALLHVPNWEGMVVRHNVALAAKGLPVGTSYLDDLSLDAVPALAAALPSLEGETGRAAAHRLKEAYDRTLKPDWRSWRWAQHAARAAVGPQKALIDELTRPVLGPPQWPGDEYRSD